MMAASPVSTLAEAGLIAASRNRQRVAIIGGGVSGTMTAVHLSRIDPAGTQVVLFERAAREAKGLAYETQVPGHLLNVRAANMSAFPDQPRHFEDWLAGIGAAAAQVARTDAGDFVPRSLYGRYLEDILRDTCQREGGCVSVRHADVQSIRRDGASFELCFADGATDRFDSVVLAMGNITGAADETGPIARNPWSPGALLGLDPERPVLIQGTGLTMIDTVIALRRKGFQGRVYALSRRGLLPRVHAPTRPAAAPDLAPHEARNVRALLNLLRTRVRHAAAEGACWRSAIDALRPITQSIWTNLPIAEQRRFLRHARPFWDAHRHRIAPPVAQMIEAECNSGGLEVLTGRLILAIPVKDGVTIAWAPRRSSDIRTLTVQRMIVATGIPNLGDTHDPLISSLTGQGLARLDDLGLGLDVSQDCQVIDGLGDPIPGLWALGPLVRGVFWECTAVPDIRLQALNVAETISRDHADRRGAAKAGS